MVKKRKGIVLAGGSGTRLFPATLAISKQLIPVYDKPAIYYPLSTLMQADIQDILVISTPRDLPLMRQLLGDGSQWGLSLSYAEQAKPEGIAQALTIAEDFLSGSPATLILGDNIFFGHGLSDLLLRASARPKGATVFGYLVQDPERYGVVSFNSQGQAVSIEEKPHNPKSQYAVTGLYFYDDDAVTLTKALKPSPRGELEITDLNRCYLDAGCLHVEKMGRGTAWLDMGTHESLLDSSNFIQTIERRQGVKIACLEEIAFEKGWISLAQISRQADLMGKNSYGIYLQRLIREAGV